MALYDNLALEGGGTKGYIYIGLVKQLEKLGILKEIKNISGASVGGIGALLLATGWSAAKIEKTFMGLDLATLMKGPWYNNLLIPYTATSKLGLYEGKDLLTLFKKIIKEVTGNENTTFAQWHELKEKHPELGLKDIFLEACNLNSRKNETFSHLSKHKDVPIAEALRASIAFPLVFTPWKIKGKLYGDGGIQNNCPYNVFEERRGVYNKKTLCARLDDADEINYFQNGVLPPVKPIDNLFQCAEAHFTSALEAQNFNFFNSEYANSSIYGDTLKMGTFELDMTLDQKKALVAAGEYGVISYFVKKHPEIAERFYDQQTIDSVLRSNCCVSFSQFLMREKHHQTRLQTSALHERRHRPIATKRDQHGQPIMPLFDRWQNLTRLGMICNRDKVAKRIKLHSDKHTPPLPTPARRVRVRA